MKNLFKKSLLLTVLPLSLFSYEINFNKTFDKKLQPDILSSNIKIRIESDNESLISTKLEKFNEYIKNAKYINKNLGIFHIKPTYKYISNTPKVDGYLGEVNYTISSPEPKNINKFLNGLINLKEHRDTSIVISNLMWEVKESSATVALDIMRFEAIAWIENYTKILSQDLKKSCSIKNIHINSIHSPIYRNSREVMISAAKESANDSFPLPEQEDRTLKLTANYILECK
ncbi:SIMPL domain-containing protein [Malaciobacter mytili]|uniref:SIMPL domain-containing protein n=1 Tax=Malaciobacter mytili LMG 24559 TaxID=1032238 RepID=A0AAX2AJH4_9BACT|nr:SIMPL domain-containing protein [Malaciobacter mytili]AXH13678.1 SIMPL domain-containing protein [Malaciobacter mytili LMG 24559]RXI45310.1 hypothetical protein CRU99_04150 [Malaciobacter mytili]RXK16290.1 hypothetical protein CP985_03800 [Malaciobacter mytili LMG 24559]